MEHQSAGPYRVEFKDVNKIFFPQENVTKGDLIDYYREVAERMLPYLEDRPIVMQRFPDGIEGEGFYQKNVPANFPDWIDRVSVKKEGGRLTHVVCNNAATLLYLANQGCITPHIWLARRDRLDNPDLMAFDLDPSDGEFGEVRSAALLIKQVLEELGFTPFLKTTGSRGLHVVAALDRGAHFDQVRAFAREVALLAAARDPGRITTEQRKAKRRGRIYIDTMRNAYAQSIAPPYSVRAQPGAPVSAPLDWDELSHAELGARTFSIHNIRRRLGRRKDPWAGLFRHAQSLDAPAERLEYLRFALKRSA